MFAVALQAARVVAYASIILDLRRSVSLPPWELLTIMTVIVVGFGEFTSAQTRSELTGMFLGFFVATEAIAPGVLLQLSTRDAYVCVDQQYETSPSLTHTRAKKLPATHPRRQYARSCTYCSTSTSSLVVASQAFAVAVYPATPSRSEPGPFYCSRFSPWSLTLCLPVPWATTFLSASGRLSCKVCKFLFSWSAPLNIL